MRKRIVSGIVAALCVTSLLTGCAKESKLATTTVESKLATTTNATVKEVETQTVAAATPAKKTSTGKKTPVQRHGRLYVKGTHIKDKNHKNYVIQGVSTHGIAWFPQYINKRGFQYLRDHYGVNTIRIAMYSNPDDGYKKALHKKVTTAVKYAKSLGMYVIIDWHILNDSNPNTPDNIKRSKAFFTEMSKKFKRYNNVIYEICNEPNGGCTWDNDIKPYAEKIIKTIRKNDKKAIIIVGTPTWSQDVDVAADNPIRHQKNIVYACHYYAATHKEYLRDKIKYAIDKGIPVLVSEFSICDASGNGYVDKQSGSEWFKFLNKYKIGRVAWSLCNKDESASLLKSSCTSTTRFRKSDLSETGRWIFSKYK